MNIWMCGVSGSKGSSAPENSSQASSTASGPYVSATKESIVVAMENSSSARRTRRQASACGESEELIAACKQQCLYFLPLPQGQGSFRPGVMSGYDAKKCTLCFLLRAMVGRGASSLHEHLQIYLT
jgi:hypothetical protein